MDGRPFVRRTRERSISRSPNSVTPLAANPPLATPLTFAGNIRLDNAQATAIAGGLAPNSISPISTAATCRSWNVNVERQI